MTVTSPWPIQVLFPQLAVLAKKIKYGYNGHTQENLKLKYLCNCFHFSAFSSIVVPSFNHNMDTIQSQRELVNLNWVKVYESTIKTPQGYSKSKGRLSLWTLHPPASRKGLYKGQDGTGKAALMSEHASPNTGGRPTYAMPQEVKGTVPPLEVPTDPVQLQSLLIAAVTN